jgi:predicted PurR-regulated permease PerM
MNIEEQLAGSGTELTTAGSDTTPTVGGAQVPPAASPEIKTLLRLAVAAIAVAALYVAQDVLIPITLAVMLSFVLSPLVSVLRRVGLWKGPAVIVSVLFALGVIGLVGTLIGSQAAVLARDAPQYVGTIEEKLERLQTFTASRLSSLTQQLGIARAGRPRPSAASTATPSTAPEPRGPLGGKPQQPVLVEIAKPETSPVAVARAILAPVLGPLETTLIVIIVAIFILLQQEDLRDRFIRLFGSTDLHRTTVALDDAGHRLSRFFVSQLGVNATFGLVIGVGLWMLGIPSPALWGGLAGLLRFVPYIGAVLAAVAPLTLAAAIDPGWWTAVYVALLFVIVEPLTGYVVEPLLYGHSTGLSPLSVIVAAVFWTWLWGPIGLILSTPLTLCLVVMGRHVKSLEFFDVLLGDRPALSAAERFYQRILADDPDETLDQAESILAGRSLLEYYDGVVLQAMKLAAGDVSRGTITRERSIEMTRSVLCVIDDLKGHEDTSVPSGTSLADASPPRGYVACVSGRGAFDDAVAAMLGQLLERRGVRTRQVTHAAVSREKIAQLDVSGLEVIALSYLELAGSPAHLRYLIRRLRLRAPKATLIVGLWPEGEAALQDRDVQKALEADVYVGSLRQAVDAVLAVLQPPVGQSDSTDDSFPRHGSIAHEGDQCDDSDERDQAGTDKNRRERVVVGDEPGEIGGRNRPDAGARAAEAAHGRH